MAGYDDTVILDKECAMDENQTSKAPAEAGKAAAVIQTERMDKAPVDGENETGENTKQTEKDKGKAPAGKYRLDADSNYVRSVLAMPTEMNHRIPYSGDDKIAEYLGVTEEWLEEKRQLHREAAARAERICKEFKLFQDKVREEVDRLGYFEVDDEFLDGFARTQEYHQQLCKENKNMSTFKFLDPEL